MKCQQYTWVWSVDRCQCACADSSHVRSAHYWCGAAAGHTPATPPSLGTKWPEHWIILTFRCRPVPQCNAEILILNISCKLINCLRDKYYLTPLSRRLWRVESNAKHGNISWITMQLHNHIVTITSHVTRAGHSSFQTFSDLVLEITAAHGFSDCPHLRECGGVVKLHFWIW